MNYIQNYRISSNSVYAPKFGASNPVTEKEAQPQSKEQEVKSLSNVTPDYGVKAPMSYTKTGELKISDDLTAQCYKLANGQKVVIVPKDGTTVVKTYVNTGSMNEPDNLRGISHYIEHNLFNGSEDLGDKVFFDEVNKMGANTNASTSFAVTDYYISSNLLDDSDLENKIKLHAGMIQSPKFLLDKLEKEKNIVNSEINMCLSEDENIGFTQTVKNLFNIKSSSNDLVAGSTDNITALTRDDVVNYFNNNYYPANMTTVITGEVNPDETMKLVSKYFTSQKTSSQNRHFEQMTPIDKPVRQDLISSKSEGGASVFLGFAGPENNNTEDIVKMNALQVLLSDLSNSKFSTLEQKYSTSVGTFKERVSSRPNDKSMYVIETDVKDDYVEPFLKELYSQISKVAVNPPTEKELTAVKNKMKMGRDRWLECSHALNHAVGSSILDCRPNYMSEYNDMIDKLTPQDISNIAKKYLDLNKVALTVVHPSNTKPEDINKNYKATESISFTGANKKTPIKMENVSEYKLSNNYDVILNDTNNDVIDFHYILNNKDYNFKRSAVADVLDYMLLYGGTQKQSHSEMSSAFDILGATTDISANTGGIGFSARFPKDNLQKVLDLAKENVLTPNLSEDNFKKAVKRCSDAYSTHEVSPFDKFDKAMYKNTSWEVSVDDKKEALPSVTLDDVKALYKELIEKSEGQVVVSGPFSKNPELKNIIFNNIASFNSVNPKTYTVKDSYMPIDKTEVYTAENKKNQAKIVEGFKFKYSQNMKDSVCIELLNEILGGSPSSRLFSDLREKRHLAYSVSSSFDTVDNIGTMYLTIGTTTENKETGEQTFDNIKKSIDGFNENIQKIKTEPVTPEELESAKKALKTAILSPLEMSSTKTATLLSSAKNPYGLGYINKKLEMIDSITADDILHTAQNVFSSKPIYSLTATKASLDANKEMLDSLVEA